MKIKILISLLLIIITIGAVSAAEENITSDNMPISDDLLQESSDEILNTNNERTFSELSNLIKKNSANSTLTLDKDYKNTDFKEGIVISKPITIDGNGHTIDANKKTKIFKITSSDVVLKNIVFKNGFSNNGGALFYDSDCNRNQIENCDFINCYANPNGDSKFDEYGGHAYWQEGGAIFFEYNCEDNYINNCNFINCGATSNGNEIYSQNTGAIHLGYQSRNNLINNSNFINCHSNGDTGAIYFGEHSYNNQLINSNFINCSSKGTAGAVNIGGEYNLIKNCSFTNISAKNSGAISFRQGFIESDGGTLIYEGAKYCIVKDSSFINCTSQNNGGAISFFDASGNFMEDDYTKKSGKINSGDGRLIDNCTFINCQAEKGGAVYLYDGTDSKFASDNTFLNNSKFINCIAGYGGAVYFGKDTNYGTVNASTFQNCSGDFGGCIYWNGSNGKIEKSRFYKSIAKNGGAIYACKNINLVISKSDFENNTASEHGGAVYGGIVYNCSFNQNSNPEIYTNPIEFDIILPYYSELNDMPITVNAPRDTVGNLSIYISYGPEEKYNFVDSTEIVNDTATINYKCTKIGDYRIKAVLNTNYGIFESNENHTISYIEFEYSYTYYPNTYYGVYITLPYDAMGNFSVYLKNKNNTYSLLESVDLNDGDGEIYFSSKTLGDVEFMAICESSYGFEKKCFTITFEDGSYINAPYASIYYNDAGKYSVEVFGINGDPIAKNTIVTIKIGSKTLKGKANSNGIVSVSIPKFKPGKYTITAKYLKVKDNAQLTVKHVVNLKSVKVKRSAKKLVLQATLKNKKPIKGKTVTFKFNGKTYKAKSNSKGIAKVTIKSTVLKKLKVGKKITYQATYLKDTVKKTVKVQR